MKISTLLPWLVLIGYGIMVWALTPRRVTSAQFFRGRSSRGRDPSLAVVAASAAITWIFAKSIANSAALSQRFGIWGGLGYALYYLSFLTAGVVIYLLRTRGGYESLPEFLSARYGVAATRLFLLAIGIRLFNEVWSNTKVCGLYFGDEGSAGYWLAAVAVTILTLAYSLRGGLRSSLLTDVGQMALAGVLLVVVLATVGPGVVRHGLSHVDAATRAGGLTFCGLALVQVLSYPFHDPILTDRAFLTSPRTMIKAFAIAGAGAGAFIFLFSVLGLAARAQGVSGDPSVAVPAAIGVPMLLIVNAIMLTSAGSTLDSTFSSSAKLVARDWNGSSGDPRPSDVGRGRRAMIIIAILGNLPLLSLYLGDRVGPAIIAATTISGTMVMGLAPIFLLGWIRRANRLSFHLAFWPGLLLGILRVIESASDTRLFPGWVSVGSGSYALDLGVNLWGLVLCVTGFLIGAGLGRNGEPDSSSS